MDKIMTGGCLCGDIRYRIKSTPVEALYCYCKICRSARGAPVVAWLTVSRSGFSITAGDPVAYNSSAKAIRCFCGRCGTIDNPRLIDVGIATLDDPAAVEPSLHIWTQSRIAWFETADHLPRYPTNERPSSAP